MFTNLLAEDRELSTYRKNLNKTTGSVLSTILLQQAIYWASKKGGEPFYKFKQPCGHNLYNDGDSWTEELGFSLSEFALAVKRIATKSTKGTSKRELMNPATLDADKLIIYWTDASRVTWYWLNQDLLDKLLISIYLDKPRSQDSYVSAKTDLPLTETTTKTTTESIYTPPNSKSKNGNPPPIDDGADLATKTTNKHKFVAAFSSALRMPSPIERRQIETVGAEPGACLEKWESAISAVALNGTQGKPTVGRIIECYNTGGTWAALVAKWEREKQAGVQAATAAYVDSGGAVHHQF